MRDIENPTARADGAGQRGKSAVTDGRQEEARAAALKAGNAGLDTLAFADRLQSLMDRNNLTKRDFAKLMGTNPTTIYRIMVGQRIPTANMILRLSLLFNVSADWLLGLSDERELAPEVSRKFREAREQILQREELWARYTAAEPGERAVIDTILKKYEGVTSQ